MNQKYIYMQIGYDKPRSFEHINQISKCNQDITVVQTASASRIHGVQRGLETGKSISGLRGGFKLFKDS